MAKDHRERVGGEESPGPKPGGVLQGTIGAVTYHDDSSLYTVLKIDPERGYDDPESPGLFRSTRLAAVGNAIAPEAGQRVRLSGQWSAHGTHGRQFEFESLEPLLPQDADGVVRYLSGKSFKGLGPTLARRIVEKLGPSALERIAKDPDALQGIPGLRGSVGDELTEKVHQALHQHRTLAFLRGIEIGPVLSRAVLDTLGIGCEKEIEADPYVLSKKVPGIGFRTADRAAEHLGFAADSTERCAAALLHGLRESTQDGHSCLPRELLTERAAHLLERPPTEVEGIDAALESLHAADHIRIEPDPSDGTGERTDAWLPWLAASESGLAKNIRALLESGPRRPLATEAQLRGVEDVSGFELHPDQRSAVLGLLAEPVALLTGGPGVGKTTIVRLVVALAEAAGARIALASPTGRAAKRLSEATEREASTVHRMLGYEPQNNAFLHGPDNPIEADLIVVDEVSMLDVVLAHHLLKAVEPPTRLILVGDPDQLPSVGPGQVLEDLITSGALPVHRLTQIYRQKQGSLITQNAHAILEGRLPVFPPSGDLGADFYFFRADDPRQCADLLVDVAVRRIPERFGIPFAEGVQVLAPMYKGDCGVDALNLGLREAFGHGGRELQRGNRILRVGDRVLHTRNDYEKGVFNGDLGRISRIRDDGSLDVRYPDQELAYESSELGDLQPAFAMTVHRSQGGEYPAVVMPMVERHSLMLQRNLLYTAVTRARKLMVLVGSRRALQRAVDNAERGSRVSRLRERLQDSTGSEPAP